MGSGGVVISLQMSTLSSLSGGPNLVVLNQFWKFQERGLCPLPLLDGTRPANGTV